MILYLAPMAGVCDSAFRQLCRDFGADVTVSEMISAKAVCFGDRKTEALAAFREAERPILIQIFGSEPEIMAKAAKTLWERFSPDGIDINMGCPVPKIVKNGEGSALMKDPAPVYEIVARVRDAFDGPLSVKIRAGRTASNLNAPEIALAAKKAGADAVCVHGRTAAQMYSPPVNREIIREVKEALGEDYPVIANGDITDAESALETARITGCDRLMIGRGALGRPWIFSEIKAALSGKAFTPPDDPREVILRHLELCLETKPENVAVREMRKHAAAYIRGFRGASVLRERINRAETADELRTLIKNAY